MGIDGHRNDISSEPSPDASEHDNLGAQDGKGTPPTVPPQKDGDVEADDSADDDA